MCKKDSWQFAQSHSVLKGQKQGINPNLSRPPGPGSPPTMQNTLSKWCSSMTKPTSVHIHCFCLVSKGIVPGQKSHVCVRNNTRLPRTTSPVHQNGFDKECPNMSTATHGINKNKIPGEISEQKGGSLVHLLSLCKQRIRSTIRDKQKCQTEKEQGHANTLFHSKDSIKKIKIKKEGKGGNNFLIEKGVMESCLPSGSPCYKIPWSATGSVRSAVI